jgi:hypothetical protein
MKLKKYLRILGVHKARDFAKRVGVTLTYLYRIASDKYKPEDPEFRQASPIVAINIHRESNGDVTFKDVLGESLASKLYPPDMFIYHEAWKQKKK